MRKPFYRTVGVYRGYIGSIQNPDYRRGEGEGEGEQFGGPDVAPSSLDDEPWKKYIVRLINFFLHFQFSLLATFAMIIMLHDHNDIGCHHLIFMI